MRGILLLNGDPYPGEIDARGARVYCCDGAYAWAGGKVRIDRNIGDFDSYAGDPVPPPDKVYPREKDLTDGEIAALEMIADGCSPVEIYGGFGGRTDHFLGNLHLLKRFFDAGVPAVMIGAGCRIFLAGGVTLFSGLKGRTVSVLPFGGDARMDKGRGFRYPYPGRLRYGTCRGISNVIEDEGAVLSVKGGGTVLVMVNDADAREPVRRGET